MERIHRKSVERQKRAHKGDLYLIYDRLMGMLWLLILMKIINAKSELSIAERRHFDNDGTQDFVVGDIVEASVVDGAEGDEAHGEWCNPVGQYNFIVRIEIVESRLIK